MYISMYNIPGIPANYIYIYLVYMKTNYCMVNTYNIHEIDFYLKHTYLVL